MCSNWMTLAKVHVLSVNPCLYLSATQGKTIWRCVSWVWRRRVWPGRGARRSCPGSLKKSGSAAMEFSTSRKPLRTSRPGPRTPPPCSRVSSSEPGQQDKRRQKIEFGPETRRWHADSQTCTVEGSTWFVGWVSAEKDAPYTISL